MGSVESRNGQTPGYCARGFRRRGAPARRQPRAREPSKRTLPHPDGRVGATSDENGALGVPRHALRRTEREEGGGLST